MDCCRYERAISRRELLAKAGYGLGAAALATLLEKSGSAADKFPNFTPRAKRVIFLFQAGGPSHLDLLDYKPQMKNRFDQDIPASVFGGQRVTGMVAQQDRFPVVPTMYDFHQHGQSGIWLSDLLPHTAKIVDEICLLRGDEHGGDQPRSGDHVHADGEPVAGTPVYGVVDRLRTWQRERKSAGLRGAQFAAQQRHGGPGFAGTVMGRGLSPKPASRRAVSSEPATRCSTCRTRRG